MAPTNFRKSAYRIAKRATAMAVGAASKIPIKASFNYTTTQNVTTAVGGATTSTSKTIYRKKRLSRKAKRRIRKSKKRRALNDMKTVAPVTAVFNGRETQQYLNPDNQNIMIHLLGGANGTDDPANTWTHMGLQDMATICQDDRVNQAAESVYIDRQKISSTLYNNSPIPLEIDIYFVRWYQRINMTAVNPYELISAARLDTTLVTDGVTVFPGVNEFNRGWTPFTYNQTLKQYGMYVLEQKKFMLAPQDTIFLDKNISVKKRFGVRQFIPAEKGLGTFTNQPTFIGPATYGYMIIFKGPGTSVHGAGQALEVRTTREYVYKPLAPQQNQVQDRWIANANV